MMAGKIAKSPASVAANDLQTRMFYLMSVEQSCRVERIVEAMQAIACLCYGDEEFENRDGLIQRRQMSSLFNLFADTLSEAAGPTGVGHATIAISEVEKLPKEVTVL